MPGCSVSHFGNRILAIKLELLDANQKPITVVLVSAYAPICAAKESIRQEIAAELELRTMHGCSEIQRSSPYMYRHKYLDGCAISG